MLYVAISSIWTVPLTCFILKKGVSASALLTLEAGQFLLCEHGRVFGSILGLYPQDTNSTPSPSVTNKNVSRHCQMPSVENYQRIILTVRIQQCWQYLSSEVFNTEFCHFLWNFGMIAVPHEKSIFRFIINWHTVFGNNYCFTVPLAVCESACWSTAWPAFGAAGVPDVSHSDVCSGMSLLLYFSFLWKHMIWSIISCAPFLSVCL